MSAGEKTGDGESGFAAAAADPAAGGALTIVATVATFAAAAVAGGTILPIVVIVSLQRIRNYNVVVHRLDIRLLLAENLAGLNQLIDDQILGFERLLHLFSPPLLSPNLEVIVLVAVAVAPNGAPHTHLHERGHPERRRHCDPSR